MISACSKVSGHVISDWKFAFTVYPTDDDQGVSDEINHDMAIVLTLLQLEPLSELYGNGVQHSTATVICTRHSLAQLSTAQSRKEATGPLMVLLCRIH